MYTTQMDKTMDNSRLPIQKLELASRNVDRALACDLAAPNLVQLMNVNAQGVPSASGLTEHDYPVLNSPQYNLHNMTQIKLASHVPLPAEILEHFSHVQCHCMMGLFPEINRAWLTVDSDIYVWKYEENSDLAYFDGLNETILCVGLVKPKIGVFHNFIKYLLVLTTAVDVVVLGVTFAANTTGNMEVIQLIPDPVFTIPTDRASISVVTGTHQGRLFLGSKEGSLLEIVYQAESGWFGKRCKKINHSTSSLSFLVPSFLNALTEEDGIVQISVDNTRNILYLLTEKGSIEIWDLGEKGDSISRVAKVTQTNLVHQAMNTVKTLDSQNFRPIMSISAVEAPESSYIHLVAVTQTGVRFYLSAINLSSASPHQRPSTLVLQHVRLPPGYSANISIRPRTVYMSNYRDRNLLLLSKVNEKDVLWCISSDLFPFCHSLMEAYTTLNVDAPVLAVAEIRYEDSYLCEPGQEAPPLVVRQHAEPPKKYIVLTSHGVHIFLKLRPVDILKHLLTDSHGQDSESVKSFFTVQKEEQACATSLILASLENEENFDIADYACRAFFVFGGEPKVTPTLNQTSMFAGSSMFSPNVISTPAPLHYQQQQSYYPSSPNNSQNITQQITSDPPFVYSPKHNGLYLYVGRILRPIWNRRCVQKVCVDPKTVVSTSTISARDCITILSNLTALHNFLQTNTQLSICHLSSNQTNQTFTQQSMFNNTSMNVTRNPMNYTIQDAQLEERQSLDSLKAFVSHCCQVLGLWKILCEHQIHDLIAKLPENQQLRLQDTTFKNLFLHEVDTCTNLIHALIDSYLGDNASVDSISGTLRDICPSLYRHEDATFSKANEKLITSRSIQNIDEKEELLSSALEMCKSIAPNINISEICKQFIALKAYRAVTELCAVCAKKTDPDNYAEDFYKNANKASDQQGYELYQKRMDIYNEIVIMLNAVHNEEVQASNTGNISTHNSNYSIFPGKITEATQTIIAVQSVINDILDYPDELMHVALYEWMMSKQMGSTLIKVDKQSLEMFLLHAAQGNEHNTDLMDLLWKYYESNGNHASAAKILNNMASKTGHTINLKKRLEYLSRAIMSMRSDKIGYAPHLGVFLRDLEDKLDIAKVQEQILESIIGLRGSHPNAEEAIMALNSGLYQMSQLYENFAEPLQLWECQLAIIDCAGYSDRNLVEKIWRNIFKKELLQTKEKHQNDALGVLLSKVKILARKYLKSVHCFPLDFIVRELELISAGLKADKSLIPVTLVSINVPFLDLLEIYNRIILTSTSDRFWQKEENEFHLAESVACLVNSFLETQDSISNADKRKIIAQCQDIVASILSNLYSKANTDNLVDTLRSLQARLSRL